MASVNSLSSTTSNNIYGQSFRGLSGLVSGMDTESMIEKATAGTRAKIAAKMQAKQQAQWKSDAFRSISDKLVQFQRKYTSYTSSTNLYSESFFNQNIVTALGENSNKVSVSGSSDAANDIAILGVKQLAKNTSGISNSTISNNVLSTGEIDLKQSQTIDIVAGKTLSVKYGGKNYSVYLDASLDYSTPEQLVESLNKSLKNVDVGSGETLADVVSFSLKDGNKLSVNIAAGNTNTFSLVDGKNGVLEALGLSASSQTSGSIVGTELGDLTRQQTSAELLAGKTITFNYNGDSAKITLPELEELQDENGNVKDNALEIVQKSIQSQLDKEFGKGRVKVDLDSSTGYSGKLNITTEDSTSVIKIANADTGLLGKKGVLNVEYNASNRMNIAASIENANFKSAKDVSDWDSIFDDGLVINGVKIDIDRNMSVVDIMDKINTSDAGVKVSYLETSDKFSIVSTQAGKTGEITFGNGDGTGEALANILFGDVNVTQGQDAIMTVDYGNGNIATLTRGSNTFDIDGLKVTANSTFGEYDGDVFKAEDDKGAVTFNAKADTEKITNAVKSMIEDFNAIIELANTEVSTKHDRDYAPLTAEQEAEMSDDEIEKWNEKAKAGLLFNNMDLREFTDSIRFLFSSNLSIMEAFESIGITTSSTASENGKLTFDEETFKSALEENPKRIAELFTAEKTDTSSGGVMTQIKDIFDKYAKTEGAVKGVFIETAGSTYSPNSLLNNSLLTEMNELDDIIATLKERLQTETDRYQSQYAQLEQVIAQMNSQSSWLSSAFSS